MSLCVVPLELKSGGIKGSKVRSQLQAGAKIAEHIVSSVSSSIGFFPVAAHGGMHRKQIKDLAKCKNMVLFQGKKYRVVLIRCGDALADALR